MSNIEREHKNNVFCIIYAERKHLLSLYNAVNESGYANEDELEVITLEDSILLRMKNDAAFLIDSRLYLYEQQSTVNPNMVLRDLYYVVEEYRKLVPKKLLYSRSRVKIPAPHFIIFYNGTEKQPAQRFFRLSDLFEIQEEDPQLELVARQININKGYNDDILDRCESLKGYMIFVDKVREKQMKGMKTEDAVIRSVDECIRENVLDTFFQEHREEVIKMGKYDFDEEGFREVVRNDGREEGIAIGIDIGKIHSIIELLEDLGPIPESLCHTIEAQKDSGILSKWHKLAARAASIADFEEAISGDILVKVET